jgi:hypothetical protein
MLLPLLLLAATATWQDHADPVCTADARWAVSGPQTVSRAAPVRTLTLFSAIPQPSCLPGRLDLTAAFFDANDELICSGTITGLVTYQQGPAAVTALEFRPLSVIDFVRWRNQPRETAARQRLDCTTADGTGTIQPSELERAASLWLYATITTSYRGMATADVRLTFKP